MSIEYTIDIQLTELGFPDILQSQDTADTDAGRRCAPSVDSLSPRHTPTPGPKRHKHRRQVSEHDKEAGAEKQSADNQPAAVASVLPCLARNPTQAPQDRGATKGPAGPHGAEPQPPGTQQRGTRGREAAREDEKNDSDDSEVSDVYYEEEVDEEEDYVDGEGVNNESGDHRCGICDLQLPSKFKLQDHMNLHTGARPYCCAECGKRFCQIYNYRIHLRTHAHAKAERQLCRICLRAFASEEDLKGHLSSTHFEKEFYECDLCKRLFTSLMECQCHVQSHSCMINVTCEVCGRRFSSPKSLACHQRRTCCRTFKCTDCAETFPNKNALLKHSFSHLGLLPYTCMRCRCHFRLAKLYRYHKCEPQRIHCVACLREFLSQEDFQQHKKDTGCWGNQEHKGDEIRCLECGQRFDTSEELKKHGGAHKRVLKCADCGKGFRSALLLMSHMGGHAGQSPCLCQRCGLGFPHQPNYDSHLKTCGQTPQPATAPKKRRASKSSSSERKKPAAGPESSKPRNTAAVPDVDSNKLSSPAKDSASPRLVTHPGVSAGSSPPDGVWKLTLDKQPPPGAKLVLFLPVSPTRTAGAALPSAVSPTLPQPAAQAQPRAALPPLAHESHGVTAAVGSAPTDLVTEVKQELDCETPLDLSKKRNSPTSAPANIPLLPVKSEPEEFDVTDGQEFKNHVSKAVAKTTPADTDTQAELKQLQTDGMDLSAFNLKKEPQPAVIDGRSNQLTEKETKMEVDVSCSAYTDRGK